MIQIYLFFNHSEFLINGLEMESIESGSIEEDLEITKRDVADLLVDRRHERRHRPVREVQDFRQLRLA